MLSLPRMINKVTRGNHKDYLCPKLILKRGILLYLSYIQKGSCSTNIDSGDCIQIS